MFIIYKPEDFLLSVVNGICEFGMFVVFGCVEAVEGVVLMSLVVSFVVVVSLRGVVRVLVVLGLCVDVGA